MPEARDRLPGRAGAGDSAVLGIRGGFDGLPMEGRGQRLQQRSLSDNKENIPPESSRSARSRTRPRKSPLPSWYPRSPLQDITAVAKALERRRRRHRAAVESLRRQERANHSPVPLPSLPPRHELLNSVQLSPCRDEDSGPSLNVSDTPSSPAVTKSSLEPSEEPLETLPSSDGFARKDRELIEAEKKCVELIDECKKVVTERLKKNEKETPKKKTGRNTLMSMR